MTSPFEEALLESLRENAVVLDDPEWNSTSMLIDGLVDVNALAILAYHLAADFVDENTYVTINGRRQPQTPMEIARALRRNAVDFDSYTAI
ncbi:hypothetical protein [Frondihabitans australicus]|uniref:Uncharacterized protein n=1 Tax=Frondihabitans australicus TaxID=386892 RepID=A0A495IER5_9MICO|nr:hypothetical protein [Frondihabitans australicus]RKR73496.1 hypothetical protein C8E83_0589 [Frondihabitans australicus]